MKHLYAMYRIEELTTMPYNLCSNSYCENFNHMLIDLLKSLSKEQKGNCLIFTYHAMSQTTTGYQPYELMFGHGAPTICNGWLQLAIYNDNYLQSKFEWVSQQCKLILAANRCAFKRMKQSAEKSLSLIGGTTLDIPIGNLVILYHDPEV